MSTSPNGAADAYRILERAIVTLELLPGAATTEAELIALAGLGRTPVREAIQRLSWEGLVQVRPRSGLAIAPLVPSDWIRVLDARRGVEMELARAAATAIGSDAGDQLRRAVANIKVAAAAGDVDRFLQADRSIDEIVGEASANPFAARVAAPLQTHSRRFWYRFHTLPGLGRSADAHLAVASAILAGDAVMAQNRAAELIGIMREEALALDGSATPD